MYSSAAGAQIPWEVVEEIVDSCGCGESDYAALRQLALTCRNLRPRTRMVLFRHVRIRTHAQLDHFSCDDRGEPDARRISEGIDDNPNGPRTVLSAIRLHLAASQRATSDVLERRSHRVYTLPRPAYPALHRGRISQTFKRDVQQQKRCREAALYVPQASSTTAGNYRVQEATLKIVGENSPPGASHSRNVPQRTGDCGCTGTHDRSDVGVRR